MQRNLAARLLAALLSAGAIGFPSAGSAAESVTVENNTGFPICELYLAPAATDDWTPDLLHGRCLSQGETRTLDQAPDSTRRDLLIVSGHGLGRRYYGLDLTHTHLRLNVTEAELFEWNPASP
jgi:hypothetical protein